MTILGVINPFIPSTEYDPGVYGRHSLKIDGGGRLSTVEIFRNIPCVDALCRASTWPVYAGAQRKWKTTPSSKRRRLA